MLSGYSIVYIDDNLSVNDILLNRRIICETWDKALKQANIMAEEIKSSLEDNNNTYILSLVKADSKSRCESYGHELIYRIDNKLIMKNGKIYIVPIFDE
jgi:hypothetical protein